MRAHGLLVWFYCGSEAQGGIDRQIDRQGSV